MRQKNSSFTSLPAIWDSSFCHMEHHSMHVCWPTCLHLSLKGKLLTMMLRFWNRPTNSNKKRYRCKVCQISPVFSKAKYLYTNKYILLKIKVSLVTLTSFWCSQPTFILIQNLWCRSDNFELKGPCPHHFLSHLPVCDFWEHLSHFRKTYCVSPNHSPVTGFAPPDCACNCR